MTLEEYQTIIEKTAVYPKEIGLAYCALGLTGEAGEVAEKVKKIYRDNNGDYSDPEVRFAVAKELSDAQWYITAASKEIGYTLEEIMQINYDKLMKRKKTNTLHGSGDNREEHERNG